jgi:hypothetical protein
VNKDQIEIEYLKFFKEFDINPTTGRLNSYPEIKFVTMPYIGSKYYTSKTKILFVGMDVGKDETPGRFQNLAERNSNIESDVNFNPHIAGTYCSALFLLKNEKKWQDIWDKFILYNTSSQATKTQNHRNGENPLSFISLTNLHKFVTISRVNRSGDENRKFIKRELEESLLLKEIEILNPNLILFQGKLPSSDTLNALKEKNIEIIFAFHPSNRQKAGRNPQNYIRTFKEIK